MQHECTNPLVTPLLTDMYQISMVYAHWKGGRADDHAVFDLFFRKNPFGGEFCIIAGTDEVLRFLKSFRFTESDIAYLETLLPHAEMEFFQYLSELDCSKMKVYAIDEGSAVFPREPLIRVEGPLSVGQLIETTLLNLINFPSLIATNAARIRIAAGPSKTLLEFGLRRAQGPDGAISASKYAYLGGFNGTSNVLAGKLNPDIKVSGTHAHAYVMAYSAPSQLLTRELKSAKGDTVDFVSLVMAKREALGFTDSNEGELAAFISYAQAFPSGVLALVDTYDTLSSGVPNFISVGWALHELGYAPRGIRLDSGDLSYLSLRAREMFKAADAKIGADVFSHATIAASNDLNEEVLYALNRQGHEIDTFGIGTHLVTCYAQPALGCVYKLVEVNSIPRIKLSQDIEKLVIPGRKAVYRLYGEAGYGLLDLIQLASEPAPVCGVRVLCRHPFQESLRAFVTPYKVVPLLQPIWDGAEEGGILGQTDMRARFVAAKQNCAEQIGSMRSDHIRHVNPTPYKISVSQHLYEFMHSLWLQNAPIVHLS